uniref:Trypsin-like serine protease n=1 Tax=Alabama argillacea TaxID=720635 RepID=A0A089QDA2_ALAAG|nr:trypsin-like serine protease precursor [Alabama argillacea]
MQAYIIVLLVCVAAVAGAPGVRNVAGSRIVGGQETTIEEYPEAVALIYVNSAGAFTMMCGGSILNQRSILSAGHCFALFSGFDVPSNWRVRAGSTYWNSGGLVLQVSSIIVHPTFDQLAYLDNDVAILRLTSMLQYGNTIQPARIAGPAYALTGGEEVWACGWGTTNTSGPERLHDVQIWVVDQEICRSRYTGFSVITENMLCAGWLDVGGRDQCWGDSGGPLYHVGTVVGITSFGLSCGHETYPGVNTRVSAVSEWIQVNA